MKNIIFFNYRTNSDKNFTSFFFKSLQSKIKISNFTVAWELFNSAKRSKVHYYYILPLQPKLYFLIIFF